MTTSTDIAVTQMTELFGVIKSKKDDIKELEKIIRVNFEKNVIYFLKEKGVNFKLVNNKYDEINRYYLDSKSPSFMHISYKDKRTGHNVPEALADMSVCEKKINYYPPKFNIVPWEFTIKFEWHKAGNQNPTKVYWHPEEMSLEDFYNKKLKKVFKLI